MIKSSQEVFSSVDTDYEWKIDANIEIAAWEKVQDEYPDSPWMPIIKERINYLNTVASDSIKTLEYYREAKKIMGDMDTIPEVAGDKK